MKNILPNGKNNGIIKNLIIIICSSLICTFIMSALYFPRPTIEERTYLEFKEDVENSKVVSIDYQAGLSYFLYYTNEERTEVFKAPNPRTADFKVNLLEEGIEVKEVVLQSDRISLVGVLSMVVPYAMLFGLMYFFMRKMNSSDPVDIKTESTKKFSDVAGLTEVKESLLVVVDMMKNPKKYEKAGARISKGVLLSGPPGTGKTLLAKAIAGEAGVNFIAASGSDFDNKYVGVGADKMRQLFKTAKEKAPCILFIDEIDSVGGKRSTDNRSFERQTLTQLLSCMDGFSSRDGITVFAATNDVESLDPALLRPGRFDSRYTVGLPDTAEDRKQIISLYLKNKMVDESVDIDLLAKETLGCSPADIEALINEAAIESVKDKGIITKKHIEEAFYKQIMHGHKKKNSDRDKHEIKTTAYHEAGHALIGLLLGEDVSKISIVPTTSGAGGVTIFNQKKLGMYSKRELENRVITLYAGRNAELKINGPDGITTGASNDIKEATKVITAMVSLYGMSEYGLLDLTQIKAANELMKTYQDISAKLSNRCLQMIEENFDELTLIAETLIEKESIDENELRKIHEKFVEVTV